MRHQSFLQHDAMAGMTSNHDKPASVMPEANRRVEEKTTRVKEDGDVAVELFSLTKRYLFQFATEELRRKYKNANPFPHLVIDDLFPPRFIQKITEELPESLLNENGCLSDDRCHMRPNLENKKSFINNEDMMGTYTKMLLGFISTGTFIEFLERLTGVENLLPDPKRMGSGVHFTAPGGELDIHADFNYHHNFNSYRRVNTFVFLNPDWKSEYGGDRELWSPDMKSCMASIVPKIGRFVVFTTTDFSYHGHPNPLAAPLGRARRSIAMYYYTTQPPPKLCYDGDCGTSNHATKFMQPSGCEKCQDPTCKAYDPNEKFFHVLNQTDLEPPSRLSPNYNGILGE